MLIGTLQVLEKIWGGDSTFWLCQESSSVRRSSPPYASPKLYKCWEALFSCGLDCHRSSGFSVGRETWPDLVLAWKFFDGQLQPWMAVIQQSFVHISFIFQNLSNNEKIHTSMNYSMQKNSPGNCRIKPEVLASKILVFEWHSLKLICESGF